MAREYRVLAALADTDVPVARPLALCEDNAVNGMPFYVMEYRPGVVLADALPAGFGVTPAARRQISAALVDILVRLHAVVAARALGFAVGDATGWSPRGRLTRVSPAQPPAGSPAVVFVGLDVPDACPRCGSRRAAPGRSAVAGARAEATAALLVGFAARAPAALEAHRLHRCTDLTVRLVVSDGEPRFTHPRGGHPVAAAGLSPREADVLVLLLDGYTTAAIAERLCLSGATVRAHCRAVLRKLGAGDRRALRTRLLAPPATAKFAEESALAARLRVGDTW
jgi:DNA-binding CsgD family transcriptional regulator